MMGIASLLFGIAGMVLVWFPESGPLSLVLPLLALGFGGAEAFRSKSLALPVAAGIVLGLLALLLLAFFYWTPPENDEPVPPPPATTATDREAPAELPQTVPAPRRGLSGPEAPVPGIGGWLPAWPSPLQPTVSIVPAVPTVRLVPAVPVVPAAPVAPDAIAEPPSPEIPAEEMEEPIFAEQAVVPFSLPEPGTAPALPSSSSDASPSLPPQIFAPPSTAASPPGWKERPANTYSLPAEMLPANATSLPAEMKPANTYSLPAEMKPANATSLPATLIPR